jgi:catechol 2,3-dioxygenase-like lactoylglutathione lyase family enzyme
MKPQGGGFLIASSDLAASIDFYCKAMQLQAITSDGSSAMLGPLDIDPGQPWLLALRHTGRSGVHGGRNALGIRALFFRVDLTDLDGLEQRLRELGGFHERHHGEFYEMVSAYDPDRTAIGFWAPQSDAPDERPSFVPPSVYFLD